MSNMICVSCGCGCKILPDNCLSDANSKIKAFKTYDKNEIAEAVNTFILIGKANDGLLGQTCFDTLCDAIKTAQLQANEYREVTNPNYLQGDPLAEFWAYLPEIWYNLLKNRHFVNMYAANMVYYYYKLGLADAETLLDGDVQHNRSGNINQNDGTKNITSADAQTKSTVAGAIAKGHYDAFINNFWNKNKSAYGCNTTKDCCAPIGNCENAANVQNVSYVQTKRNRPRPTAL